MYQSLTLFVQRQQTHKQTNTRNLIYLLTADVWQQYSTDLHTQTIHRTTQNKQYTERHKYFGTVRAVPRLCGFYPGICLTTEEKTQKAFSKGSRRVTAGSMKIYEHTIRIHGHKNKNT